MGLILAGVGVSDVLSFVVGCVGSGVLILGFTDKRRKDVKDTWEDLATARKELVDDQNSRISVLEAKVELLKSDFVADIVRAVIEATEASQHGRK